jgi:hypothetical protein
MNITRLDGERAGASKAHSAGLRTPRRKFARLGSEVQIVGDDP